MTLRTIALVKSTSLAAVAGALSGLALALLFGADVGAALAHGVDAIVLPAFQALNLSGFATCL